MSRDHRRLRAFQRADALVLDIYRMTRGFPVEERFTLQSQTRRAALSAASNIVEGSARRTTADYVHFLNIAAGSAAEARYLVTVALRLGFIPRTEAISTDSEYRRLSGELAALMNALRSQGPEP